MFESTVAAAGPGNSTRIAGKRRTVPAGAVLALIEALVSAVALHTRGTLQNAARMTEAVLPWLHGAGRAAAHNACE